MKITADTNVLVRALVQDEPEQARAASALLEQAELVAIPLPVLCELVWVLRRVSMARPGPDCTKRSFAIQTTGSRPRQTPRQRSAHRPGNERLPGPQLVLRRAGHRAG